MMYEFLVFAVLCLLLAGGVGLWRERAVPRQWALYIVFGTVSLVAFGLVTAGAG